MTTITVYIPSVIYFKDAPLSYTSIRSTFPPQERINQTITTIQSIREYIPGAHIVLVEMWVKNLWLNKIVNSVDTFMYIGDRNIVRKFVDSPYKWAGEIIWLLYACRMTRKNSTNFYVKISWRYHINSMFGIRNFLVDKKFSFLESKDVNNIGSYSTRMYAISQYRKIYRLFALWLGLFFSFAGISIEVIFYYLIPSRWVHKIKILWISWLVWVNGDTINE